MSKKICRPDFSATFKDSGQLTNLNISVDTETFDCNDYEELCAIEEICDPFGLNFSHGNGLTKKLVLPKTVIKMPDFAFRNILQLNTVVWPDACEEIPFQAFYGSAIENLLNTDNVKYIDPAAFSYSHIKSFHIPDGVTMIPKECFFHASYLTEVTGGRNVEYLGDMAFGACEQLKSFNIPEKVIAIPQACFYDCTSLAEAAGLDHVTSIEGNAFCNCRKLEHIPSLDKAMAIGDYAFYKAGLKSLDLDKSICAQIGSYTFAHSALEEFKPGYFLSSIESNAFANTKLEGGKKWKE